jgi:Tol biopolymer transport system component
LKGLVYGFTWTPNGREIIFSYLVFDSRGATLWKLPVSVAAEPEQLPFNTGEAFWPAISRSGNRLAYQRWMIDANIWRLSLSGPGVASGPATQLIASTRWDLAAQYCPDSKRIAFESDRSGADGIWVSDADGSSPVELFSRRGEQTGAPCWSPDGQRVAFAFGLGKREIYSIRASGGKPTRLTTDSAAGETSSWSRDGRWVYFSSERTGRSEVWKVSAAGGEAVQVSRNGGETAFESADGKSIFYTNGDPSTGLWKMPVSGGEESQVLTSVVVRTFCLVNDGIYFIPEQGADGKSSLQFLSFATLKVKTVAAISRPDFGLSVSPDGRSILFSQDDEIGIDLMLVENFR